jgi:hypothetical protein
MALNFVPGVGEVADAVMLARVAEVGEEAVNAARTVEEAASVANEAEKAGSGAEEVGQTAAEDASAGLTFSEPRLASQLAKHGDEFGVAGPNNAATRETFLSRLVDHIDSPNTTIIVLRGMLGQCRIGKRWTAVVASTPTAPASTAMNC